MTTSTKTSTPYAPTQAEKDAWHKANPGTLSDIIRAKELHGKKVSAGRAAKATSTKKRGGK